MSAVSRRTLLATAGGATLLQLSACAQETGASGYCDPDSRATLLLVDRSTHYDPTDQAAFAQGLNRIYTSMEERERLVVQTITDEYAASSRVFDRCIPACASGTTGPFGTCSRFTIEEERTAFLLSLRAIARDLVAETPELPRSEILMTIALATRETQRLRRLFVFSDLLENSPATYPWPSMLTQSPDALIDRARAIGAVPSVAGAAVTVFGFGRDHTDVRRSLPPEARGDLSNLWRALFLEGGAASVEIALRIA